MKRSISDFHELLKAKWMISADLYRDKILPPEIENELSESQSLEGSESEKSVSDESSHGKCWTLPI